MMTDDDQMQALCSTLLATGRGRRPSLPTLAMDNKLLYQLHLLRKEGNYNRKTVEKWFKKLFPDVAYPAERVGRQIDRIVEKVHSLTGDDQTLYLSQTVKFNFISEALQEKGVDRLMNYSSFIKCQLTNQLVIDMQGYFTEEKIGIDYFLEALNALSTVPLQCTTNELSWRILNITKGLQVFVRKKEQSQTSGLAKATI